MLRPCVIPLTAALIAASSQVVLGAGNDPAADAEKKITELYKIMAIGLMGGKVSPKAMLILKPTGTMLPKTFDPEKNDTDRIVLSEMVDAIPKADPMFIQVGTARYSDAYRTIVNTKQLIGGTPLTQAEKDQLEAAKAALDESKLDAFRQKEGEYLDLLDTTDTTTYSGNQRLVIAKNKMDSNGGFEYHQNMETFTGLMYKDGRIWWDLLRDRLKFYEGKDPEHPRTFFSPKPSEWASKDGWTTFTYKNGQTSDSSKISSESITASVQGSYKWFSTDTSFSKNHSFAEKAMSSKNLIVTFKAKAVDVYRPWMEQAVFSNNFWRFPKTLANGVVSFGSLVDNAKAKPEVGIPVLTTRIILIKDLELTNAFESKNHQEFSDSLKVDSTVGLGPFTLKGGYDKRESGDSNQTEVTATGVKCKGMQVIGYIGVALDASPAADITPAVRAKYGLKH